MRATGRLPALAFAALILGTATAAMAAELVVVEVRGGVSLKQGDAVDDAKPIKLEDGQMVTLVADDGSILTLRGPYDQAPTGGKGGVDVASALGALTTGKAQNVAGVVRSANTDIRLPAPWLVDVSHPGVACLRAGEQPVLWRQSDAGSGTLTMMPADRSWRAQAPWPVGSPTMQTPNTFPIKDGRTYLADFGGKPVAVTLTQIPPKVTGPKMQAAWMLEKGCVAQAEALLRTVR